MAIPELTRSIGLLARMPVLWVPGVVAGALAAILWLIFAFTGTFFAGRLLLISGLVLVLFITGMLCCIRDDNGSLNTLLREGARSYFRVLLPQLVIVFVLLLIFVLIVITMTLAGSAPDPVLTACITFIVMVPSLILTFFSDAAAVFENRGTFDAIRRSISLVGDHVNAAIAFFVVSIVLAGAILFCLMIAWEAALYDRLEPITHYTQAQIQAFTPDQLLTIIGHDGSWITALVLFVAGLILVPLLVTYKACFFRSIAGQTPVIQQMTGEYDEKGRWYKY